MAGLAQAAGDRSGRCSPNSGLEECASIRINLDGALTPDLPGHSSPAVLCRTGRAPWPNVSGACAPNEPAPVPGARERGSPSRCGWRCQWHRTHATSRSVGRGEGFPGSPRSSHVTEVMLMNTVSRRVVLGAGAGAVLGVATACADPGSGTRCGCTRSPRDHPPFVARQRPCGDVPGS